MATMRATRSGNDRTLEDSNWNRNHFAVLVGRVAGRKVYRVPVRVRFNDSRMLRTDTELRFTVLAHDATEAANWVRGQVEQRPETEIDAWGPQGGRVSRFIGYESAIWAAMCVERPSMRQLRLDLGTQEEVA